MTESTGKSSDFSDTDPWESTEALPQWDPSPGPEPGSADLGDPWDGPAEPWSEPDIGGMETEVVPSPRRFRHRLATRPIELIRSHRLAVFLVVAFTVAAFLMLSSRPIHEAHSRRPAKADHPTRVGAKHR
jgi:hypothetical protein